MNFPGQNPLDQNQSWTGVGPTHGGIDWNSPVATMAAPEMRMVARLWRKYGRVLQRGLVNRDTKVRAPRIYGARPQKDLGNRDTKARAWQTCGTRLQKDLGNMVVRV